MRQTVRKLISLLVLVSFAGLCTSCGKKSGGKTCFPVKGQVLFKDQPVAGALVVFEPTKPDPNWPSATGTTDEEGRFRLSTYDEEDGAPAGEYNVGIAADRGGFKRKAPLKKKADPDPLKGRFSNPKTSKIHARVEEKPNDLPPFNLK
jgi:hypothetical protein